MARMTAAEAGRKGGRSRSPKKLAAIRRNGFQPMYSKEKFQQLRQEILATTPACAAPPVLLAEKLEE